MFLNYKLDYLRYLIKFIPSPLEKKKSKSINGLRNACRLLAHSSAAQAPALPGWPLSTGHLRNAGCPERILHELKRGPRGHLSREGSVCSSHTCSSVP